MFTEYIQSTKPGATGKIVPTQDGVTLFFFDGTDNKSQVSVLNTTRILGTEVLPVKRSRWPCSDIL